MPGFPVRRRLYRNQSHRRVTVTREHHVVARFRAAHQFCQLRLASVTEICVGLFFISIV
jgi:hypothetical protein